MDWRFKLAPWLLTLCVILAVLLLGQWREAGKRYDEGARAAAFWWIRAESIIDDCQERNAAGWADHYGYPAEMMGDVELEAIVRACMDFASEQIGTPPWD